MTEAGLRALHLVARGRIPPTVTGDGYAAWRVGPPEPSDVNRLMWTGRAARVALTEFRTRWAQPVGEELTGELRRGPKPPGTPLRRPVSREPLPPLEPVRSPTRQLVAPPAPGIDPAELAAIVVRAAERAPERR